MFQIGDIVEYHSGVLGGPKWIGVVVGYSRFQHIENLKVKFFNDDEKYEWRILQASKFTKVS